jgi:hypothetical protein
MPSSTGVQFTVESIEGAWREGEKHCTLVWAGKGVDHKDAMLLVTQTWARAEMFHPIQTFVKSEAWMGPQQDQHAWLLSATEDMQELRQMYGPQWNMSNYREWRPHITAERSPVLLGHSIILTGLEVWHQNQFRVQIPFVKEDVNAT